MAVNNQDPNCGKNKSFLITQNLNRTEKFSIYDSFLYQTAMFFKFLLTLITKENFVHTGYSIYL